MYHVLYFTLCTLTLRFQFFALFVTDHTRKQKLLINFVFIEDLSAVSQSNIQTAAAKNEEQYTLSNIIYIQFQNCCFFPLGSILKKVLLKSRESNSKIFVMELFFRQNCRLRVCYFTKNLFLYKFCLSFWLSFVGIYKEFLEMLQTSVSQKTF